MDNPTVDTLFNDLHDASESITDAMNKVIQPLLEKYGGLMTFDISYEVLPCQNGIGLEYQASVKATI